MTSYEDLMHSDGTTAYETFSVIMPSAFIIFITGLVISKFFRKNVRLQLILEFVLIVIPLVLIVTVLAKYATNIIILLIIISITLMGFLRNRTDLSCHQKRKNYNYITSARGIIFVLTVISILAVDFPIFPRHFTKTRDYGYSLMDVGVGLYVYGGGILAYNINSKVKSIKNSLINAIPLIILGCGRFIVTKEIDYQVITSEYGVHWNFFLTLATTQILSSFILNTIKCSTIYVGGALLLVHECFLQLGLARFVLSNAERDTFLKANREGIVSSLGYLGLYFLSVGFGKFIDVKNTGAKFSWKLLFKYCSSIGFLLWATFILEKNFGISRRLANSGYCIWILFIGVFMVALLYVLELLQNYVFGCTYVPLIFEAINYNPLTFFLTANLLTGAINIVFDTLSMNWLQSLVILILYMMFNCVLSYFWFMKRIRLK
ncbi:hypothetical protein FQA39_LY08831 [Lamprigera yunnana]|nr:hypothetical protein FQA39_LY08831 [Lamprigera yunnana]